MAGELRWILLLLSLPVLAAIWWWSSRRSGQAPGNSALRESTAAKPVEMRSAVEPSLSIPEDSAATPVPSIDAPEEAAPQRPWGVPPFEPLSIHTGELEGVPVLDGPMMIGERSMELDQTMDLTAALAATPPGEVPTLTRIENSLDQLAAAARRPLPTMPAPPAPMLDTIPVPIAPRPAPPPAAPAARAAVAPAPEKQRIVTVRVCAPGEVRWDGTQLMRALEEQGMAYGRYQVFHRTHVDGKSLFCAASLIEPGTFDVAQMPSQEFRGVTLFAVLPGPVEPMLTIDELLSTARGLAESLQGKVVDSKGIALSPQRAAALRDDIARFQASLAVG